MTEQTSPHPQAPRHINPRIGVPAELTTYLACEYTDIQSTPDGNTVTTRCIDRAIMMPGYYRSCARHILHTLQLSVAQYVSRPASGQEDSHITQQLTELVEHLRVFQAARTKINTPQ